jgi:hypothetical protein
MERGDDHAGADARSIVAPVSATTGTEERAGRISYLATSFNPYRFA